MVVFIWTGDVAPFVGVHLIWLSTLIGVYASMMLMAFGCLGEDGRGCLSISGFGCERLPILMERLGKSFRNGQGLLCNITMIMRDYFNAIFARPYIYTISDVHQAMRSNV